MRKEANGWLLDRKWPRNAIAFFNQFSKMF
jgi:hypothetical protein